MSNAIDAEADVPVVISIRTKHLKPLLVRWRDKNPRVAWKHLLSDALKEHLKPLAGKRMLHLVGDKLP